MTTYRILDIETETHPYAGHPSSPYCKDNYIVAAAWRDNYQGDIQYVYHDSKEEADKSKWLQLDGVDVLVCFNAAFEMQWLLSRHNTEFIRFLKRGGRVFDPQLAEYLVTHQTTLYPNLHETSMKYGAQGKVDGVSVLWNQGVLTSEIDKQLLLDYLCFSEDGNDITLTELVFKETCKELLKQGMWRNFIERCEGLVAYSIMMFNGMKIDRKALEEETEAQRGRLIEIDAEINKLVPDLPEELEFNWASLYHRSALLFGGTVKYKGKVPYDPVKWVKEDVWQTQDGTQYPCTTQAPEDAIRYASGKNKGLLKVFKRETDEELLKWGEKEFTFRGLIDCSQLPKDARDKLDSSGKRLGEWVSKLKLADGSYVKSTSGEVCEYLATQGFEAGKLLAQRISIVKDLGILESYPEFMGEDDVIHHTLNSMSTATTRLSSAKPNMQNAGRSDTSNVKRIFITPWGSQGRVVAVDYQALEVVGLAALSGDKNLLKVLEDGIDTHSLRLASTLDMTYEEVLERVKNEDHPEHEKFKVLRTHIKPMAFAFSFGASASGMAYSTGRDLKECEKFIENETKLFPESTLFRNKVLDVVEQTGQNELHREQQADGTWKLYHRGWYQDPTGTKYSFREYLTRQDGQEIMQYKLTQAANYPVQGFSAMLVTATAGRVMRWLLKNDFYNGKALLCNAVHDCLYINCHESVAKEVGTKLKAIMEDAPKYLAKVFNYPALAEIKFPAASEWGVNQLELKHLN